ncbi:MarR family transcriptional regulator [Bacillus salipaludis]|uniref:MarR family transcriptional regulator n=1 Tax=Bacillus salipaludis TaxID=2547811 RepID=A0A4R5VIT4_9BACI|nr:MarR family winged helix-turn-helix transcriptional regulator [Bacillus salipaludis]MDQ6596439.1 MarR family winged helix-turn-helix transcriptional regulator [Bacillus salipaludis]TDK53015.1 MarR family transcriptional regulator [Bacillus salipaludis]
MDLNYNDPKVKQVIEVYQSFWAINKTTAKLTKKNAENFGLSLQQLSILNTLLAFPELTQQELADRLISAKSTISAGVDKLVEMGLVERGFSEEDRIEVKLKLTSKGEDVSKKSSKNSISYKAMLFALDKMPREDIQSLLRIQNELLNHLIESGF